jgi:hypothetical protein
LELTRGGYSGPAPGIQYPGTFRELPDQPLTRGDLALLMRERLIISLANVVKRRRLSTPVRGRDSRLQSYDPPMIVKEAQDHLIMANSHFRRFHTMKRPTRATQ